MSLLAQDTGKCTPFLCNEPRKLPRRHVKWSYFWEYLLDGRTPIRAISDEAIGRAMQLLRGSGTIVELGAGSDYYRSMLPQDQPYEKTDLSGPCDRIVDMTDMPYPDDSVDAFVSIFSLEHVYEYQRVFAEVRRTLKPGGRFLLVVPFLYYYHAAPDDYIRLTRSAIERHASDFHVLHSEDLGNRSLLMAEFLHEKKVMGHQSSWGRRLLLRIIGSAYVLAYLLAPKMERQYAAAYLYVLEKR
jgi:SAM-dependent methyltransferase